MAFKTFVPGATLTAAEVNTYLAKQAVIVCTSSTRPSSPPEGMTIYETDTDKLLVYTTATTGWQPPWNMPWGEVASVSHTSNQTTTSGSATDVSGMSTTFTAVANRRYRALAEGKAFVNAAAKFGNFFLVNGSGIQLNPHGRDDVYFPAANAQQSFHILSRFTASGSTTVKLQFASDGATTLSTYFGLGGGLIIVEDIGPAGAPA